MLTQSPDLIFLIGSLIAYYVASRAAVDALDRSGRGSPGLQAIGHAIPIAAVALGAAGMGHPHLAVGVLFSTAVAALSLAAGLSMLAAPSGAIEPRGVWALVLPAALMAWMAGFTGRLLWIAAAALVLEGIAIAGAWGGGIMENGKWKMENGGGPGLPVLGDGSGTTNWVIRILQLVLAIVLAGMGVWMTLRAGQYVIRQAYFVTEGLFAAAVIAPLLVLPMIGQGVGLAQRGQLSVALGAQVGVALLNLCLLLPLTGVVWWGLHRNQGVLGIPLAAWRIDTVGLVVLGMFLLCLTLRACRAGKGPGGLLLVGYLAYLFLSLRAALGG